MPTDDVSDLRDVVDAINKLCETMKTSYDYDDDDDHEADSNPAETVMASVETEVTPVETDTTQTVDQMDDAAETWSELSLAADIAAEMYYSAIAEASLDMWNDSINEVSQAEPARTCGAFYNAPSYMESKTESLEVNPPIECGIDLAETKTGPPKVATDIETRPPKDPAEIESGPPIDPVEIESDHPGPSGERTETHSVTSEERKTEKCETEAVAYETTSEMYYTASSEVSLLSDTDFMEKVNDESDKEKSDKNIMAGHVAAMRERFESMTRANTPCPDLVRSLSPSLDMFRNITPSPDFLDKS